jgi:hypothetical protein
VTDLLAHLAALDADAIRIVRDSVVQQRREGHL